MKRLEILLWIGMAGACLLMPLPLPAQENKQEDVPTLSADSLITGDARMDSLYRHLPEVMVVGERPVVRASAGKLEYDLPRMIQDRPVDNIYEALKELPGVVEQDGALKLGMQGVTVVLDGKVTNMSTDQLYALLKSMPADRIERVEVMYNAPARYQVRGAMINVRLRRRIGDPGVVQGELYGKYNQEHEASFEERASLLYNGNKFSADFLYSHSHGDSFNTTDKEARHWQQADGSTHLIDNYEEMRGRCHTHSFRVGTDYALAENHSLSFVYNGSYSTGHTSQSSTGTQTAESLSEQTSWLHNGRLDYQTPIGLKAGAEFTWYNAPGNQLLHSRMGDDILDFYTEDGQRINAWKFYLAQEHQLKNGWGLNYGAVYTTSVDNSYQTYEELISVDELTRLQVTRSLSSCQLVSSSPRQLNDVKSRRREQTLNLYAGFSKSFGQKLMTDFSLAVERYKTPVWDEWDVYPVLNLTYLPADGHILQLNFSSDKSYPAYWAVQDVISYLGGGYSEIHGNPLLKPAIDYSMSLTYILKSKYVFRAWFNHTKDRAVQTLYQSPDELLELYKYLNFDFEQQAGLQASVPFKAGRWLNSRLTLLGLWMRQKDSDFYDLPFDRTRLLGIAVLNNTFTLSRKPDIRLTIDGRLQGRAIQGIYDIPTCGDLSATLRYTFLGGNAVLTAWCRDILQTSMPCPQIHYGRQWVTNNYSSFRSVGLSFTWKFGGYKEKKREEVDTSRFK